MLFNSLEYFFFLPLVFGIYWSLKKVSFQNIFLLAASYFFYGLWDYRFLSLILISSLADYLLGRLISSNDNPKTRKFLLTGSIVINLGILGVFKYYDFFVLSLMDLVSVFGIDIQTSTLNVILPVGISFYTFQTLSYTIDVYRGKLEPTKNALNFFTYVAFFPQLVAGPIERATRLLPQIEAKRIFTFDKGKAGLRQILWGMFLKVVVADNCGVFVDQIFGRVDQLNAPMLILGAVLFGFQIYGDFAGYSEIARGTANLLGIDLMRNFSTPYFARDVAEFWRRWHISLSTWFRDYVYIPLGGSQKGRLFHLRNVFIVFLVSGLWHGANWTFIIWGLIHALWYIPLAYLGTNRKFLGEISKGSVFCTFADLVRMMATYSIVTLAWVFFRAENLQEAWNYLEGFGEWGKVKLPWLNEGNLILTFVYITILVVIEWLNRQFQYSLERLPSNLILRYAIYLCLSLLIVQYFAGGGEFIYFQF